ncbi:flavodoxin family protein [Candidatus Woesearchaeota archaeon]|nr:flavodoxin family protein [Candidatus Woesearchaeota archaeon]
MPKIKIIAINSSPRKGNTDFMLDTLLNSAERNGADVSHIRLREKDIHFCGGGDNCCPKTGECEIKDDMPAIYKELESADIIILASPSYFSNVSARMKNFIDRCNPYWFNKKLKGKKAFLIGVGSIEESIKEMLAIMENFLRILDITCIGSYHAVADKAGDIGKNVKVIKELEDIGASLR